MEKICLCFNQLVLQTMFTDACDSIKSGWKNFQAEKKLASAFDRKNPKGDEKKKYEKSLD